MSNQRIRLDDSQDRLEEIIKRMQKIQRAIKASGQPASMLELMELKDLGREYALIIEYIANSQGGSELA
ncbi:MAG: hypothetical protein OEN52_03510 [Gammaproteobacteria bacterium]|nr:hypothetical protein [Gammaproteobacteria bacterium]MDH3560006.1 hypothetical protein [Gammaproteobacteria bacterium]